MSNNYRLYTTTTTPRPAQISFFDNNPLRCSVGCPQPIRAVLPSIGGDSGVGFHNPRMPRSTRPPPRLIHWHIPRKLLA